MTFTYTHATVPAEILSGADILTENQLLTDPYTEQSFELI